MCDESGVAEITGLAVDDCDGERDMDGDTVAEPDLEPLLDALGDLDARALTLDDMELDVHREGLGEPDSEPETERVDVGEPLLETEGVGDTEPEGLTEGERDACAERELDRVGEGLRELLTLRDAAEEDEGDKLKETVTDGDLEGSDERELL